MSLKVVSFAYVVYRIRTLCQQVRNGIPVGGSVICYFRQRIYVSLGDKVVCSVTSFCCAVTEKRRKFQYSGTTFETPSRISVEVVGYITLFDNLFQVIIKISFSVNICMIETAEVGQSFSVRVPFDTVLFFIFFYRTC